MRLTTSAGGGSVANHIDVPRGFILRDMKKRSSYYKFLRDDQDVLSDSGQRGVMMRFAFVHSLK